MKKVTFTHARKALQIPRRARFRPGSLMDEFIAAFDELLAALESLATDANRGRLEHFRPLLATYRQARHEAVRRSQEIRQAAPSVAELARFEGVIQRSFILQELVALETLLNAPNELVPQDEKQDKGEDSTESVKNLLKKPVEWWMPDWFKDFFDALLDTIDELLALLRGGKKGEKK